MRPLSPAAFELRACGVALVACGVVLAAGAAPAGDPRAGGLGLAGALLVVWVLCGARAVRRATRLALPVGPRWSLETAGATVARVGLAQVAPTVAFVAVAGALGAGRAAGAPSAAAGALVGIGLAALLAASRIRAAERALGRRLLRRPHVGPPLGRRSLYLEPVSLAAGPGGATPAAPWPAHRPAVRPQRSAIEMEPVNGAARHTTGVSTPRLPPDLDTRLR